jgi:hypothetical protein
MQFCLSPQCGFASTAEGNLVAVDDQIAKVGLGRGNGEGGVGLMLRRKKRAAGGFTASNFQPPGA